MDKDTQHRLEKGREHYDNREYDLAEPYLLKVLEATGGFADVKNMLGVIYHAKGQVSRAQEYFEKALEVNPRYTEAALNLSVVYNERGLYGKAKKIHAHITSLKPVEEKEIEPFARGKLANMHAELGRAYAELQLIDKAVTQYQKALALCPDFVDIRTKLGQVHKDAGNLVAAKEELLTVKKMRPSYIPARISLGVTYFADKDKNSAKREWEEVLTVDPDNKTAGMYVRMVEQLIAQEEAEASGVHLEVEKATTAGPSTSDELDFSFEGERSSVMPATPGNNGSDDQR